MKKLITVLAFFVLFVCAFLFIIFGGKKDDLGNTDTQKENIPYNYDLSEYVTLGEYPNIKVDPARVDELVATAVDALAQNFAEQKEVIDRPIKNGDTANIDYVGTLDGVAFNGGTAQGTDLVIGSGNFIDGFEDGLIGHSVGEEVKLDLTFPESYHSAELAGKSVVFTVKINKITESIVPELNDTMILALKRDEYKTVEEFNAFIRKMATENVIWESYVASCEVKKYPEKEVAEYTEKIVSNYSAQASYYNTTLETLISSMGFSSVDQFKEYAEDSAKGTVKAEMIMYHTARTQNITVSDEEYKTMGLEIAKENEYESVEKMEEALGKEYILLSIYQKKMIDTVYNTVK